MAGNVKKWLAALVAAIIAIGGVTVATTSGPDDHGQPHRAVTITVGGGAAPRSKVVLPPSAQAIATSQAQQAKSGNELAAHADLHEKVPPSPELLRETKSLAPPGSPALPAHPPLAAVNSTLCETHLVRNFSSRPAGSHVLIAIWHYTVSSDRGKAGVLGNVAWFDNPAAQASSNYIMDRHTGYCVLAVAEASKAWAQLNYNSVALSVEVTALGNEPGYLLDGAGFAKAVALARRFHRVYGLPYRRCAVGSVNGRATVLRTGFCQHSDLGALGGGHHDIQRTPGASEWSVDRIWQAAQAADVAAARPHVTASDRARCTRFRAYRQHKTHTAAGRRGYERNLARFRAKGLRCTRGKVVAR